MRTGLYWRMAMLLCVGLGFSMIGCDGGGGGGGGRGLPDEAEALEPADIVGSWILVSENGVTPEVQYVLALNEGGVFTNTEPIGGGVMQEWVLDGNRLALLYISGTRVGQFFWDVALIEGGNLYVVTGDGTIRIYEPFEPVDPVIDPTVGPL